MTRARRLCILTFIEQHNRWPAFAEPHERHATLEGAFAIVSGREVSLTSLGELETGHPHTDPGIEQETRNPRTKIS